MNNDRSVRNSFRHIPTLETERLVLRKILLRDVSDFYEYARDPETSRYLLWEPHRSRRFTFSHLLYLQRAYAAGTFFDWALILKENGKMIGTCGFTEIYEKENRCEVGYVLSPRYHRMGLAPEALTRVLQYGFGTLGLEKASGRFMEGNEASRKVLERLGFWDDTVKKESFFKRGKEEKIFTYSILKEEFLNR